MSEKQFQGKEPTVWILGNQLLAQHPALVNGKSAIPVERTRILMIESRQLLEGRRWHPWKLVLVLSAMRHYADRLQKEGFEVDYVQAGSFLEGITQHIKEYDPARLICMASSNYDTRRFQEITLPARITIPVQILPNSQFLVEEYNPYPEISLEKNIRQETFYRRLRLHYNVLMDADGDPLGGKWNYDAQNRKPLPADFPLPDPLTFPPDPVTQEVIQKVEQLSTWEKSTGFGYAVDHHGAAQVLEDFLDNRLVHFGTYEDAMTSRSHVVYHSVLSPYLNIGLLDPLEVIQAAEKAYHEGHAPLNSVEGFIRQVLGWREYIYWQYWRLFPELMSSNHLGANRELPEFFWTGNTDLNCLSVVLQGALRSGYNHHIERLMVLSNFCTLTGVQPIQVLDWFLAVYLDGYPWVMAPNVIGMGLYAEGGRIGTKPYISAANYINKMSDYCQDCSYDPKKRTGDQACPFNFLYWNFLLDHETKLRSNPRMNLSLANLNRLELEERKLIHKQAKQYLNKLS